MVHVPSAGACAQCCFREVAANVQQCCRSLSALIWWLRMQVMGLMEKAKPTATDIGFGSKAAVPDNTNIGFGSKAVAPDTADIGFGSKAAAPDATNIGFGREAAAPDIEQQPLLGAADRSREDKNVAGAVGASGLGGAEDKGVCAYNPVGLTVESVRP